MTIVAWTLVYLIAMTTTWCLLTFAVSGLLCYCGLREATAIDFGSRIAALLSLGLFAYLVLYL